MVFEDFNFNSGEDYQKILLPETFILLGWVFKYATFWVKNKRDAE